MTQYNDEPKKADQEKRRKRTGDAFLNLRQRVEKVCGDVGKAGDIADLVDDVISRVSSLIDSDDAREFLGEKDLSRIRNAADKFRSAKGHLDRIVDACDKLQDLLNKAGEGLSESPPGNGTVDGGHFRWLRPWHIGVIVTVTIVICIYLLWPPDGDNGPNGTATPTATASTTASGAASTTASATGLTTASATASTTGSTPTPATPEIAQLVWGDLDCNGEVDPTDSLLTLRVDAGLSIETDGCPEARSEVSQWDLVQWAVRAVHVWGDADCNGDISPVDSLDILRSDADLSYNREADCPEIGASVAIVER